MFMEALSMYKGAHLYEGGVARTYYRLAKLSLLEGKLEEAEEMKKIAGSIWEKLTGTEPFQNDTVESYDQLVPYMDR
jgi:hypothetical protein